MKCKFIIFLIALTSCTHTARSQNNITLSVDVEKTPEMGFVISYLKESMIGMVSMTKVMQNIVSKIWMRFT